jgi:hypothetical protein
MVKKSPISDKAISGHKFAKTLAARDFPLRDKLSHNHSRHKKTPSILSDTGRLL